MQKIKIGVKMTALLTVTKFFISSSRNTLRKQFKPIAAGNQWTDKMYLFSVRCQSSDQISGKVAAKQPFEVELVKGKRYAWCKCGYSNKQPFCDGQHRRYACGISPIRFKAEETCTAFLCGCKQTSNAPYCDGTHMTDKVQTASTA